MTASIIIDVVEGRKVAIFDVPGAYLHAEMPDDQRTLMVLRGDFVDIMCQVNPDYEKFVSVISAFIKSIIRMYPVIVIVV